MIFDPKEDFSLYLMPWQRTEVGVVPVLYPTTRGYIKKESRPRIHAEFLCLEDHSSLSIDLPVEVGVELAQKIENCYNWRDQALDEKEEEDESFLVMFRYMGSVELQEGVAFQFAELGVCNDSSFSLRLAKSKPGDPNPDFASFLIVSLGVDPEPLLAIGRQLSFIADLILD